MKSENERLKDRLKDIDSQNQHLEKKVHEESLKIGESKFQVDNGER